MLQGEAKKAKAAQAEAAKKEIAELMAKAKADMDKVDKKGEAKAAQSQADEIQKEVPISSDFAIDASAGTAEMLGPCTLNSMLLVGPVCRAPVRQSSPHFAVLADAFVHWTQPVACALVSLLCSASTVVTWWCSYVVCTRLSVTQTCLSVLYVLT